MSRPWILDYDTENCTIGAALAIVGEKWTFLVLREAFNGVHRFDDIRRHTRAPRQLLSDRLARPAAGGPGGARASRPRSEYRLTEKGLALSPLIVALLEWGNTYAVSADGPLVEL